jgi:hypothetical protein
MKDYQGNRMKDYQGNRMKDRQETECRRSPEAEVLVEGVLSRTFGALLEVDDFQRLHVVPLLVVPQGRSGHRHPPVLPVLQRIYQT